MPCGADGHIIAGCLRRHNMRLGRADQDMQGAASAAPGAGLARERHVNTLEHIPTTDFYFLARRYGVGQGMSTPKGRAACSGQ
jgi:hypothetical protein